MKEGPPPKHDCPDCRMCQHCPESRCLACRGEGPPKLGLSMAEQIERFERLNADDRDYCRCRQGGPGNTEK